MAPHHHDPAARRPEIRELLRYARGSDVRVYSLHLFEDHVELWRDTERAGLPVDSVKETDFTSWDEAADFIVEVRNTLIAGRWTEC